MFAIRKSEVPGNKTPFYVYDTETGIIQRQCTNISEAMLMVMKLEWEAENAQQQEAGR